MDHRATQCCWLSEWTTCALAVNRNVALKPQTLYCIIASLCVVLCRQSVLMVLRCPRTTCISLLSTPLKQPVEWRHWTTLGLLYNVWVHEHTHSNIHPYRHTHTHTHTYTHSLHSLTHYYTHTHTYIYTHTLTHTQHSIVISCVWW